MIVQVKAVKMAGGAVHWATPAQIKQGNAITWAVYAGMPGAFEWLGDFVYRENAVAFAEQQAKFHRATLDLN